MPERIAALSPPWLQRPAVCALFEAFPDDRLRFVGGCVRDSWLGDSVSDFDAATPLEPSQVTETLEARGWRAIPLSLAHGTILALPPEGLLEEDAGAGFKVEITTLRRDTVPDGRHAQVDFVTGYAEDAARRDFTINALYLDAEGRLYDYFAGLDDLAAGRLRFIGDPQQRLAEDWLRALRFIRFFARFGTRAPDAETFAALDASGGQLARLSVERIASEFERLLSRPRAEKGLELAQALGFLLRLDAAPWQLASFERWQKRYWAQKAQQEIDAELMPFVAALWALKGGVERDPDGQQTRALLRRWKRSGAEQNALTAAVNARQLPLHEALYRQGVAATQTALLLSPSWDPEAWQSSLDWQGPRFPLRAADLQARGFSGVALGQKLKQLEAQWVASQFTLSRSTLLDTAGRGKT